MKWIATGGLVIALAACATDAQNYQDTVTAQYEQGHSEYGACLKGVGTSPDGQFLRASLWTGTNDGTAIDYLAYEAFPSMAEVEATRRVFAALQPCREIARQHFGAIDNRFLSALNTHFGQQDVAAVAILKAQHSWGEINAFLIEDERQFTEAWNNVSTQIGAEIGAAHQAELAQRQRALQALAVYGQNMQALQNQQNAINALNRPRTTNCRTFGYNTNCTTY